VPTPQEIWRRPRRVCDRPQSRPQIACWSGGRVHNHYKRLQSRRQGCRCRPSPRSNILARSGPTVCGQELCFRRRRWARILDVPVSPWRTRTSALTEAGYVGEVCLEHHPQLLPVPSDYNVERPQRGSSLSARDRTRFSRKATIPPIQRPTCSGPRPVAAGAAQLEWEGPPRSFRRNGRGAQTPSQEFLQVDNHQGILFICVVRLPRALREDHRGDQPCRAVDRPFSAPMWLRRGAAAPGGAAPSASSE